MKTINKAALYGYGLREATQIVRHLVESYKDADLRRGNAIRSKEWAMSDYWEGRRDGLNEAIGMMQRTMATVEKPRSNIP